MWEVLVKLPLGRLSMRKFIMLFATLLVVTFGYSLVASPSAYAADANWVGGELVHSDNTYEGPKTATANNRAGLEKDTVYYTFRETPGRGFIIYFAPGADPPTATTATLANADFAGETPISSTNTTQITLTPQTQSVSEGTTSCAVEGIGYVVCPVSNFIAAGMDKVYAYIAGYLEVQPLATNQDQAMYRAWSAMRDIANILFVIAFLIIVYGQITGAALTNYTIKKLLPRLVIAAILVNVSYWICSIAVDIFNILGYGVQDLFISIRNSLVGAEGNSWDVVSWESMTNLILSGGTILGGASIATYLGITAVGSATAGAGAAGGVVGLIILLLPMLIGLIFIVLVTFIILATRQALITIFIILAPLAFVAYLLPNTEQWFNKWRDTFLKLLMLFPAFSVIFGGSQLASAAIIQNATGPNAINMILLAMAVQVAPLAITPILLKFGGGVLNRFANIVNDPTKGVFDRGKNWAKDRSGERRAAGIANLALGRKIARDAGEKGSYKVDKDGNPLLDANGDFKKRRNRYNPYNVTSRRDYGRRRREGMKSADEALADGLFEQTTAGREVYNRNQDASGAKHYGENANYKAYKRAMAIDTDSINTRRRQEHHEAHVDKGIGDLYEEKMTNHAERDLKERIARDATLKDVKIKSDIDSQYAKFSSEQVEAEAVRQYTQEFSGSSAAAKALRKQRYQIIEDRKAAEAIENTIKSRGEARYERISTDTTDPEFNQVMRDSRLNEVEAADTYKKAEAQWNKLVENIRAKGADAPSISTNLEKSIAGNVQQLGQDIEVEQWATEAAKRETQANMSTRLKNDEALRTYAGGVGGVSAANRIYAKAKKDIVGGYMEEVDNSRSVLSEYTARELVRLHTEGIDRDNNQVYDPTTGEGNTALVDAALQEIALNKGNNWAFQKMRDRVADMSLIYDEDSGEYFDLERDASGNVVRDPVTDEAGRGRRLTNQDEIDRRRDVQQLFADAAKKSKLRVANLSQTELSAFESGVSSSTGQQAIIRDVLAGKFDQEKIVSMDVDELQRMVQVLRRDDVRDYIDGQDPEALERLMTVIDKAQANSNINGAIKDRERGVMNAIAAYVDPRDTRPSSEKESEHWIDPANDNVRTTPGAPGAVKRASKTVAPSKYDINTM